jgi:hypothetical protein
MDESSQVDVGKALFPLCLLAADGQTVLLGDHLQMPPIIATQPPRGAEWLVGSIQEYLRSRYQFPLQELLINYRSAAAFVEFGKRIGYPPALSAYSEDLKLHRIAPTGAKPADWRETVPWFPTLNDILEPERRLVAITYADGKSGQANAFEADLVCRNCFSHFRRLSTTKRTQTAKLLSRIMSDMLRIFSGIVVLESSRRIAHNVR